MMDYLKLRASNFEIKIGDISYNKEIIKKAIIAAEKEGVNILLFPELSLIGASLYDGYKNEEIIKKSKDALIDLKRFSKDYDLIFSIGLVIKDGYDLFNTVLLIKSGDILGAFTKDKLKDYEKNVFSTKKIDCINVEDDFVVIFNQKSINIDGLNIALSIGENEYKEIADSLISKSEDKIDIVLNPASYIRYAGSFNDVKNKIEFLSQNTLYLSANSGLGESSTDFVYEGLNIIANDGKIKNYKRNESVDIVKGFDLNKKEFLDGHHFNNLVNDLEYYDKFPYLPKDCDKKMYVEDVFDIVSSALIQRMKAIGCENVILGLSGGLDSTMTLLFIVHAFKKVNLPFENIHLYTMPAFGTSKRTKSNAYKLSEALGIKLNEIVIKDSVNLHLKDIGHDGITKDIAYENSQARERTQILFDIGNMKNALVIGTGDKSEISQGFATYNGDHMSSYTLNSSLTKTELRYIVSYLVEVTENEDLRQVLDDILKTPISPELKSNDDGNISQKTEDIIGPYELIDFFTYEFLNNISAKEIYKKASVAFKEEYSKETIKKWLISFYKRLTNSQFKRSVSVDGPAITKISFSPRTGFMLPSDMSSKIFVESLETI
ncbi:MAG: NAD(+) synthase [Anaerococcus porci]|nr:NAD(+) synthase [Anaerococcus porci]MDY3005394.1 NAD(+) synthase [Anaerococcus porci]